MASFVVHFVLSPAPVAASVPIDYATRPPTALRKLIVPMDLEQSLADLWKATEQRFREAYGEDMLLGYYFSKLQDIRGGDIVIKDKVGKVFRAGQPLDELQLFVHLHEIDRDSSLPVNSRLRPQDFKKQDWEDLSTQEQHTVRKRRAEQDCYGRPLVDLDPDTPVISREPQLLQDDRPEPARVDEQGFQVPHKPLKKHRKHGAQAPSHSSRASTVLVASSQPEPEPEPSSRPRHSQSEVARVPPNKRQRTNDAAPRAATGAPQRPLASPGISAASTIQVPTTLPTPDSIRATTSQSTPPSAQHPPRSQFPQAEQLRQLMQWPEDQEIAMDDADPIDDFDEYRADEATDGESKRPVENLTTGANAFQLLSSSQQLSTARSPSSTARSQRSQKAAAAQKWSNEEDRVVRKGMELGWDSKRILKELPQPTPRTQSGIRNRKAQLRKVSLEQPSRSITRSSPIVVPALPTKHGKKSTLPALPTKDRETSTVPALPTKHGKKSNLPALSTKHKKTSTIPVEQAIPKLITSRSTPSSSAVAMDDANVIHDGSVPAAGPAAPNGVQGRASHRGDAPIARTSSGDHSSSRVPSEPLPLADREFQPRVATDLRAMFHDGEPDADKVPEHEKNPITKYMGMELEEILYEDITDGESDADEESDVDEDPKAREMIVRISRSEAADRSDYEDWRSRADGTHDDQWDSQDSESRYDDATSTAEQDPGIGEKSDAGPGAVVDEGANDDEDAPNDGDAYHPYRDAYHAYINGRGYDADGFDFFGVEYNESGRIIPRDELPIPPDITEEQHMRYAKAFSDGTQRGVTRHIMQAKLNDEMVNAVRRNDHRDIQAAKAKRRRMRSEWAVEDGKSPRPVHDIHRGKLVMATGSTEEADEEVDLTYGYDTDGGRQFESWGDPDLSDEPPPMQFEDFDDESELEDPLPDREIFELDDEDEEMPAQDYGQARDDEVNSSTMTKSSNQQEDEQMPVQDDGQARDDEVELSTVTESSSNQEEEIPAQGDGQARDDEVDSSTMTKSSSKQAQRRSRKRAKRQRNGASASTAVTSAPSGRATRAGFSQLMTDAHVPTPPRHQRTQKSSAAWQTAAFGSNTIESDASYVESNESNESE